MVAVAKDLMDMKVSELKDELDARGKGRTGSKPFLRRRLHATICACGDGGRRRRRAGVSLVRRGVWLPTLLRLSLLPLISPLPSS